MATSSTSATNKIILNFGWIGPNTWKGGWSKGGLDVRVVDLKFKDAKTEFSVHLPANISPAKVEGFSFTCRRYRTGLNIGNRVLDKETQPDSLSVTIEQIQNLTINARIFEKSSWEGNAMLDSSGKIIREERILKSDRTVGLKIPEALEIGKTYRLLITSVDLDLTARVELFEEEKIPESIPAPPKEDAQLTLDRDELLPLLVGMVLGLMGLKLMEFGQRLKTLPSRPNLVTNSPMGDQTNGLGVIKEQIKKMDKDVLKELLVEIRTLRAEWNRVSVGERPAVDKKMFRACVRVIGSDGLVNLMRTNIKSIIKSTIPPDVETLIQEVSVRFKDLCLKHA